MSETYNDGVDTKICDSRHIIYREAGKKRSSSKAFQNLRGFAFTLASCLALPASTFAADIEAEPPRENGDAAFIVITGEIKSGDDEKFRKIAAEYSDALVLLNSDGGMIRPAMDIGRTIKLRGYKTAIYKTDSCASACALIWIAGSKRVIFEGGEVGFHASYLDTDGTKLETGVGNALVGHYLSQLGFAEKTVVFATLAPPDKILWLNEKTASMSGIDFDMIADDEKQQAPKVAESQPAPPPIVTIVAPSQQTDRTPVGDSSDYREFMGDAKHTLRSPEAFAQALRQVGFQASVSYDDPEMPSMEVGVSGEKIAVSFSGCNAKGCNYIQIIDWYNDLSKIEFNAILEKTLAEEYYSHPIWFENKGYLAFYNYMVIGSDGITIHTLIDNMEYFVQTNKELLGVALEMRRK